MGWREYAKQVQSPGDNRDNRDNSSAEGANVPNVPNGSPPLDPFRAVKLCRAGLASLDPVKPLHRLTELRWRQLLGDAAWLLANFGTAAFCDGWTAGELFGLWWWDDAGRMRLKAGFGGIAERLQESRSLKLTADRACWRSIPDGGCEVFLRTASARLTPLWQEPGSGVLD